MRATEGEDQRIQLTNRKTEKKKNTLAVIQQTCRSLVNNVHSLVSGGSASVSRLPPSLSDSGV